MQKKRSANSSKGGARGQARPAALHPAWCRWGLTAPMASDAADARRPRPDQASIPIPSRPARRRRIKLIYWQGAVHLNPLRRAAPGSGRQPHLLRAAGGLGFEGNLCRRWPPRSRPSRTAACRPTARRDLEVPSVASPGTTAPSLHRRRRRLHGAYAGNPATSTVTTVTWDIQVEQGRFAHRASSSETCAVLGRTPRGHRRLHSSRHVFEDMGAKVARPGQHRAGGHRPVQVRRLQAGRHGARPNTDYHTRQPAVLRRARRKGGGDAAARRVPCCRRQSSTWPGTWRSKTDLLKRLEAAGKRARCCSSGQRHRVSSCST